MSATLKRWDDAAFEPIARQMQQVHAAQLAKLARLRATSGIAPGPSPRAHVREVVLVASSSRGGSTTTAEALRRCPGLSHLPAEVNPYLRLTDLVAPLSGPDDSLQAASLQPAALARLDELLAWEIGVPERDLATPTSKKRFALQLACRMALQWPSLDLALDEVEAWLTTSLEQLRLEAGWLPGEVRDLAQLHARFLQCARRAYPCIHPGWYDLPAHVLQEHFPDLKPPSGPPTPTLLEEPPFVTVGPWRPCTREELASQPLIIKTPSNAYRVGALKSLFPSAQLRYIHLVRSAAASINGLYDGWRHRGFHAHRLPQALQVPGYSDHVDAASSHWWKFDLPPGWEAWTSRPLVEICSFQWQAAHRAVLHELHQLPASASHRLHFEHLAAPPLEARAAWERLERWLGRPLVQHLEPLLSTGLPHAMTTAHPRPGRWRARESLLAGVLADPEVTRLMKELGYGENPAGW